MEPSEATNGRTLAMHRFVSALQVLAGDLHFLPCDQLLDHVEQLAEFIPDSSCRVEQAAVSELLHQLHSRLASTLSIESRGETLHIWNVSLWRTTVSEIRRAHAVESRSRVVQFRRILDARFAEPTVCATCVARAMNLSVCHFLRLIKRETGHGFPWHLRRIRVSQAKQLLADSALSIKEISGRVGYLHPSEFQRQFRRETALTPSQYRTGVTRTVQHN
jgi:AraC-like DNA-binding protein